MKYFGMLLFVTFTVCTSLAQASGADDIRASLMAVANAAERAGQESTAKDLRVAIVSATDEELYLTYKDTDLGGMEGAFMDTATAFDAVEAFGYTPRAAVPSALGADFPDGEGYPGAICPLSPNRSNADALLIAVDAIEVAGIALQVAEGIWSVSDRACGTVVVAIGAVGNPQNAVCIIADVVLFAAKALVNSAEAIVNHIAYCDGAVDSAEIEGAYERSGHIHDDLSSHDTDIKSDLSTHDADIKALLTNIQGGIDENQRLIQILTSRQLEILNLLVTPNGQRSIDESVLTCTGVGDDCPSYPELQLCENGSLAWNCSK
jgi:hypothetical protein